MKKIMLGFFIGVLFFSCGQLSDKNEPSDKNSKNSDSSSDRKPRFSGGTSENEQVQLLILSAKQTMDSIDLAYKNVRSSEKLMDLSLDDRQTLSEALLEMNNAKELIILETQKQVIEQLNEKSSYLKSVVFDINAKTDEMKDVCKTINHISSVIKKTTDLFAMALTSGIVKPKMDAKN